MQSGQFAASVSARLANNAAIQYELYLRRVGTVRALGIPHGPQLAGEVRPRARIVPGGVAYGVPAVVYRLGERPPADALLVHQGQAPVHSHGR